jgi:hypothetical protein
MKYELNEKIKAFSLLKKYADRLTEVSYDEIVDLLSNGIKRIPFPIAKLHKEHFIDRARKNENNKLYKHTDELSYIKDDYIIQNKLTKYGRANLPHQVMFYGALKTPYIQQERLTAIAESSDFFRNTQEKQFGKEYYTLSRWRIKEELQGIEIVFSDDALNNNEYIKKSYEKQKEFLINQKLTTEEIDFYLDFLNFISNQFSKRVNNHEEYKISVAYANIALSKPYNNFITYPSVQTEYWGENIALKPEIVDKYLEPVICSTHILYKDTNGALIDNDRYRAQNIDFSKDLEWIRDDSIPQRIKNSYIIDFKN